MKRSIPIIFLTMIILILLTNNKVLTEEAESETTKKKQTKNYEENDEFDDPSLLKTKDGTAPKKKKKKDKDKDKDKDKEKEPSKKKEEINQKTKEENVYPSPEELKKDEYEEMNKYKYFFLRYLYEISMISLILFFILNAIIGVKINKNIANNWFSKNRQFFEDNYAHLGGEREYNPSNLSLIKDSYHDYKFFASGRVYVGWMLIDISLKRRQDLISMLSQIFLFTERDRIMFEVSLLPSEDVPFVFSICKRRDVKSTKKTYIEIDELTEGVNPSFMDSNYILLTENEDVSNDIFSNKKLLAVYKKIEKYIDFIMFTDRRNFKDKHGLVVSFELKGKYTDADLYDMTIFTHMLIDILGSTSLKGSYKKEALARRKEYDAKRSRELAERNAEELKNAKDEKKNAELNKPMTREQLQKKEEKERKEALKERRKKLYKVVKA